MRPRLPGPRRRVAIGLPAAFLLFCLGGLPGCYLVRLGCGQLRVASGQRPIEEVLADPSVSNAQRAALRLIGDVRRFGIGSLGLEAGESYTTFFDTHGRPVLYNVTAARVDRLEAVTWWFPVTGTVAYKGFFSREDAVRERDYLERVGYDALLSPVSAYSTLGWCRDPVLSTMLDDPPEALAELVLHEMTHATVYAAGQTDFNEQLASFVGGAAAEAFFVGREGPEGPTGRRLRARRRDASRLGEWLRETREALETYYGSEGSAAEKRAGREAVFVRARVRYAERAAAFETDTYAGICNLRLNNAVILALGRYNRADDLLVRALAKAGDDLRTLLRHARAWAATDDPRGAVRRWLDAGGGD